MDMDAVSPVTPLLVGSVLQQQTPIGGFTDASLTAGWCLLYRRRDARALEGADHGKRIGGATLIYDLGCVWGGGATDEGLTLSHRMGEQTSGILMVLRGCLPGGSNQAF